MDQIHQVRALVCLLKMQQNLRKNINFNRPQLLLSLRPWIGSIRASFKKKTKKQKTKIGAQSIARLSANEATTGAQNLSENL